MGACACEEEEVGDVGMGWVWDRTGERRDAMRMIKEGSAWTVVSDGRKYAGVGVCGLGVLCLILRFDEEEEVP